MPDIDPETGYEYGVAQRPGAPFPEKTNIPTAHSELETPKGIPSAFDQDVLPTVEDGTLAGTEEGDVPFPDQPEVDKGEQALLTGEKSAEEKPARRGRAAKGANPETDASKTEA